MTDTLKSFGQAQYLNATFNAIICLILLLFLLSIHTQLARASK